jgi:hypothetical protein
MVQNRPGLSGFALGLLGLGLGTLLRVLPMMGWQPSPLLAGILVVFSAVCILAGLSIFASLLMPIEAASSLLTRYRNVLLFWLFGLLIVGFMVWQSITIYRLQPLAARGESR